MIFFGVLEDVVSGDPLVRADAALFNLLQSLRSDSIDRWMVAMTELGDTTVTLAVSIVAILWLVAHKAWRAAIYGFAAVGAAALFTLILKAELGLARPTQLYSGWEAFAFPSSHAVVSAALYGYLAVLVVGEVAPRWRIWVVATASVFVVSIAVSRLYLGAHWLSDVVAGSAFGVGWVALLSIAYLRRSQPFIGATRFCVVIALTVLTAGAVHIDLQHSTDMARYAVREATRTMRLADWWQGSWTELPARRIDLSGALDEPFMLQWAGPLDALKADLVANGWRAPVSWSHQAAFAWMAPQTKLDDFPVLPQLHNGREAALVLIRGKTNEHEPGRFVLRLWANGIALDDQHGGHWPLWIGTVVEEHTNRLFGILTLTHATPDTKPPRDLLMTALRSARAVHREETAGGWTGSVVLAHSADVPLP